MNKQTRYEVKKRQFTTEGRLDSTIACKQVTVEIDLHSKRGDTIDLKQASDGLSFQSTGGESAEHNILILQTGQVLN